jgi:hypothetical protein
MSIDTVCKNIFYKKYFYKLIHKIFYKKYCENFFLIDNDE